MSDTNSTTLADILRTVQDGKETALEVYEEVMGGDDDGEGIRKVVAIQSRSLQPEPPMPPQRAESPRRNHFFHDVDGFTAYLNKYKSSDTVVWANVPDQSVQAVLDEKADTGFEILTLKPAIHPLFRPWLDMLSASASGEPLTMDAFAEFVMTNRSAVVSHDPRELVMLLSQVKASKHVTIERGRGMKSINGVMIETTIQGQKKNEFIDLPEDITIEVPLFIRTEPRAINIDLLAVAGDCDVYMRAVSADVESAQVDAFEEMCNATRAIEDVVVTTGEPSHLNWNYIRPS